MKDTRLNDTVRDDREFYGCGKMEKSDTHRISHLHMWTPTARGTHSSPKLTKHSLLYFYRSQLIKKVEI